jgi:hypothetical protein
MQRDLVPLVPMSVFEAAREAHRAKQAELDSAVKDLEGRIKESGADASANADEIKALEKSLKAAKSAAEMHRRTPLPIEQAYAVAEAAKIEDVPIQHKGDPAKPGEVVRRRFLTVLGGEEVPPEDKSSGRLRLAEWIVDRANPLTARVMVNRIWQHHFGKGLVPTPNDFGRQGKPPTHPELLDWLASRFVAEKWSIKSMHRLIMLSRTYRLSSRRSAEAAANDPGNEWSGSFPRRRLDAEAFRDSLLAVSGNLDPSSSGAHPFPAQPDWKFTQHNPFRAVYPTSRRSVYLMTQRIQRHPYLAIFDGADPSASTPVRVASTTPLQALYLLNDSFVHEQAAGFARRVLRAAQEDSERLKQAYLLALARLPDEFEMEHAREFLAKIRSVLGSAGCCADSVSEAGSSTGTDGSADPETESWSALCRTLIRLNEFAYLD